MPLQSGVYSVIHSASNANLTAYTYNQVYAGADTTAVINGSVVEMVGGSTLDILVKSISGTSVYVIGDPINVLTDGPSLNNYRL